MTEVQQAGVAEAGVAEAVVAEAVATRWQAVERPKTYELVLQQVEEQILGGHLKVGDRLPAERDLAGQLGVSRSSIREAIRMLEAQGVVVSGVGGGADGGTVVAALPAAALSRVLRLHLALASFDLAELVDARVTLERSSVQLAARDSTEDDLAAMADLLAAMEDPTVTREAYNDLDTAFHVAVARASHNRLVADVTVALRSSLRGAINIAFADLADWDQVRAGLTADHRAIVAAIQGRDPEAAAAQVEHHIREFAARMLDQTPTPTPTTDDDVR